MYVADNYGSKWVKGILNWFRSKTLSGIEYDNLIIEATLECGLRRNKLIELVNEYVETGLLITKEGKIYWVDERIKPLNTDKLKETSEKTTLEERLTLYDAYRKQIEELGEKPLSYKEWKKEINKNEGE